MHQLLYNALYVIWVASCRSAVVAIGILETDRERKREASSSRDYFFFMILKIFFSPFFGRLRTVDFFRLFLFCGCSSSIIAVGNSSFAKTIASLRIVYSVRAFVTHACTVRRVPVLSPLSLGQDIAYNQKKKNS